jgi:hypothetical protein
MFRTFVSGRPTVSPRRCSMWVKPEFEVVELCMEVTTYMHHR